MLVRKTLAWAFNLEGDLEESKTYPSLLAGCHTNKAAASTAMHESEIC